MMHCRHFVQTKFAYTAQYWHFLASSMINFSPRPSVVQRNKLE